MHRPAIRYTLYTLTDKIAQMVNKMALLARNICEHDLAICTLHLPMACLRRSVRPKEMILKIYVIRRFPDLSITLRMIGSDLRSASTNKRIEF